MPSSRRAGPALAPAPCEGRSGDRTAGTAGAAAASAAEVCPHARAAAAAVAACAPQSRPLPPPPPTPGPADWSRNPIRSELGIPASPHGPRASRSTRISARMMTRRSASPTMMTRICRLLRPFGAAAVDTAPDGVSPGPGAGRHGSTAGPSHLADSEPAGGRAGSEWRSCRRGCACACGHSESRRTRTLAGSVTARNEGRPPRRATQHPRSSDGPAAGGRRPCAPGGRTGRRPAGATAAGT